MDPKIESLTVEHFDDRWYKRIKKDGTVDYYPSVTTKLGIVEKPFLARWRGDVGNREADIRVSEAQERGSRIHFAWYTLNQGGVAIYQPVQRPNFINETIDDLKKEHNGMVVIVTSQDEMYDLWKLKRLKEVMPFEIIAGELTVYSDKYREAGTVDNIIKVNAGTYMVNGKSPVMVKGGLYIADLKTGKSIDQAPKQMAAYASMVEESQGVTVDGTMTFHTGAKTKGLIPGLAIHVREEKDWREDFEAFREISKVWEREHAGDRPDVFDFPALIKL